MKVVVAYNDDAARKTHLNETERIGEEEVAATADEIARLTGADLLAVREVKDAIACLRRDKPDLVFNLCEGVQGNPRWEMHFALALEMLGIPFTGCDPVAVGICGDKWLTKRLLQAAGIPTPAGALVTNAREARSLGSTRAIVKPALEDAGIGIEPASVCTTAEEIAARCDAVIRTYRQPALVEEFIEGRELNQALFHGARGVVVLPPGEIVFADALAPEERVVGWKAKWAEGSEEDRATRNRTPAEIDDAVRAQLAATCARAAAVLSLGGYCRFDVRQRPSGELCIVDVNPNPDLGAGSGFRRALDAAGIAFEEFLRQLMIAARSSRAA